MWIRHWVGCLNKFPVAVDESGFGPVVCEPAPASRGPGRLQLPASVDPRRIAWVYAGAVVGYHVIALLAVLPWFFSWTGVVLTVAGCYIFGTLGITLCYHRLLAHRGFICPKWLEHTFALLGVCCLQDTPAHWVAVQKWRLPTDSVHVAYITKINNYLGFALLSVAI